MISVLGRSISRIGSSALPGVTVCRAHAGGPLDGLDLMLKGGQMGGPDLFERLVSGQSPSAEAA